MTPTGGDTIVGYSGRTVSTSALTYAVILKAEIVDGHNLDKITVPMFPFPLIKFLAKNGETNGILICIVCDEGFEI
jgi:hypothetical protein